MTRVFLSPPDMGSEERRMLLEAFDSNWIAPIGPDIDAFERDMAERTGVAHPSPSSRAPQPSRMLGPIRCLWIARPTVGISIRLWSRRF
jgi:hypothetical protein